MGDPSYYEGLTYLAMASQGAITLEYLESRPLEAIEVIAKVIKSTSEAMKNG